MKLAFDNKRLDNNEDNDSIINAIERVSLLSMIKTDENDNDGSSDKVRSS